MAKYIPKSFIEEAKGLSDAIDLHADYIIGLHLFTEIQKSSCSFIGAWGNVSTLRLLSEMISNSKALVTSDNANLHGDSGKHMLHARAVQWDLNGPFRNNHQITVYHSTDKNPLVTLG